MILFDMPEARHIRLSCAHSMKYIHSCAHSMTSISLCNICLLCKLFLVARLGDSRRHKKCLSFGPTFVFHNFCLTKPQVNFISYVDFYFFSELISVAARGGPSSILNMECPTSDCKRNIGLCVTDSVASPEDAAVFHKFAILSYVDNNSKIKWCPAPDCNHAIAQKDKEENDMECFKMHRFCWKVASCLY